MSKKTGKSAARKSGKSGPENREKAILAAYFRLLGMSQARAAKGARCSERSVWGWENQPELWAELTEEAERRWLSDIRGKARAALDRSLDDPDAYATNCKWVLERLSPAFDKVDRQEHTHRVSADDLDRKLDRLVSRVAGGVDPELHGK